MSHIFHDMETVQLMCGLAGHVQSSNIPYLKAEPPPTCTKRGT